MKHNYPARSPADKVKICYTCEVPKPSEEFSTDNSRKDRRQNTCKACRKAINKVKGEDGLTNNQRRSKVDRENPERVRRTNLKSKYGLTPEEWDLLLAEQKGVCAVCKGTPKVFHTDHDHVTGKVRGILCSNCNTALGLLQDSPDLAQEAANYLTHHKI